MTQLYILQQPHKLSRGHIFVLFFVITGLAVFLPQKPNKQPPPWQRWRWRWRWRRWWCLFLVRNPSLLGSWLICAKFCRLIIACCEILVSSRFVFFSSSAFCAHHLHFLSSSTIETRRDSEWLESI